MRKTALIVAGGIGKRMNSEVPKQFLPLLGKPVILHTFERFQSIVDSFVLVLPASEMDNWEKIRAAHSFNPSASITVVAGGETRYQSVKSGLDAISGDEGLVAIHDGVRPLVPVSVIEESFRVAEEKGNAVASVALKESIRSINKDGSTQSEVRSRFRIIQTPQTFRLSLIRKAYKLGELPFFTDDASVLEYAGEKIELIEGDYSNIKITTPEDMVAAAALI